MKIVVDDKRLEEADPRSQIGSTSREEASEEDFGEATIPDDKRLMVLVCALTV